MVFIYLLFLPSLNFLLTKRSRWHVLTWAGLANEWTSKNEWNEQVKVLAQEADCAAPTRTHAHTYTHSHRRTHTHRPKFTRIGPYDKQSTLRGGRRPCGDHFTCAYLYTPFL